jgi:antibiotic biosynthesis monooxygenase (ABM) superfamily enzyme
MAERVEIESGGTMIGRVWHGWTTPENADDYEQLLRSEIFPGIAAKGVKGYRGIELFRRDSGQEVEFMTLMWFDTLESVKQFAGESYERAYVPPQARELLLRFDEVSQHYEIREALQYR